MIITSGQEASQALGILKNTLMQAGKVAGSGVVAGGGGFSLAHDVGSTSSTTASQSSASGGSSEISTTQSSEINLLKIPDAQDLTMSETVKGHIIDLGKSGQLSRSYLESNGTNLLINEIMHGSKPIPDKILPHGLRWDVTGTYRGTFGKWELVVDLDKKMIVHFLFSTH